MYKLLLCLRYLRTRYIALASIVSVTLGVATMIVVNSVMAGFGNEMRDRIHGILADVIIEANDLSGEKNPEFLMARVEEAAGEYIAAMTPTVEIYGMLTLDYMYSGRYITRPITLVGILPAGKGRVGPLKEYLESYQTLREDGAVLRQPLRPWNESLSWNLTEEAREHRRRWRLREQLLLEQMEIPHAPDLNGGSAGIEVGESGFRDELAERERRRAGETEWSSANPQDPVSTPQSDHSTLAGAAPPFADEPAGDGPVVTQESGEPAGRPLSDDVGNPFSHSLRDPWQDGAGRAAPDLAVAREGRLFVGMGLISFLEEDPRTGKTRTQMMARPGDDVRISTVTAGRPPKAAHFHATIVDVFKSGMSEYDANLVFCNLEYLQKVRGMLFPDETAALRVGQTVMVRGRQVSGTIIALPDSGRTAIIRPDPGQSADQELTVSREQIQPMQRSITSIQIKLKDFNDAEEVVDRLQAAFPPGMFTVRTWEQKQGPLLAAVEVESAILNVLLFLIIAVAGFGILAIFFMIVVEKTRDIGILKALGAGSGGVMSIFLSYGLALGVVGSGVGVVLGLLFVEYINTIEGWITWLTGRKVFDEKIYYFPEIPTTVSPLMVLWVAAGAMTIAVLASVLPARRAARLHPVQALRYE